MVGDALRSAAVFDVVGLASNLGPLVASSPLHSVQNDLADRDAPCPRAAELRCANAASAGQPAPACALTTAGLELSAIPEFAPMSGNCFSLALKEKHFSLKLRKLG